MGTLGFDRAGARPRIQPALQGPATYDAFKSLLQLCKAQALWISDQRVGDAIEKVVGKDH